MIKQLTFAALLGIGGFSLHAQETITGTIEDAGASRLGYAQIYIQETQQGYQADEQGNFKIEDLAPGDYTIVVSLVGYKPEKHTVHVTKGDNGHLVLSLNNRGTQLSDVEVFGAREKQPEKLDQLTRLPLKPSDQIQSISVISDRLIEAQGNLTISDATRNVPGVYTFATYGNQRESMSMRGYRGVPVLKNGVRVNSDFRGTGILADMQGVESIQVLKGASAITQGVATDIGSPGGVINIVTKTPKFVNGGAVSLRVGSWNQVRPAFDVQAVLDKQQTVAFRLNGVYESAGSYRPGVDLQKMYINPSLEWRPDEKTTLTLEMDYMNDTRTPDPGTINMAANDSNAIFAIPYDYFPGFSSNKAITHSSSYTARISRQVADQVYLRASYMTNRLNNDGVTTSFSQGSTRAGSLPELPFNQRYRTIGSSSRVDNNSVVQIDVVGKDINTGGIKHTFMAGVDYRSNFLETGGASMGSLNYVDIIDFNQAFGYKLPSHGYVFIPAQRDEDGNIIADAVTEEAAISLKESSKVSSKQASFGFLAQDVISLTDWAKVFLGVRYSAQTSSSTATSTGYSMGNAWNPQLGLMIAPVKNLNLFASYTNSTSLSGATNLDTLGNELGNQRIDQIELGLKSDWFDHRLRFNLTVYKINNRNMALALYDENWNPTGFYTKGGNDERKGLEVEVLGRPLRNLELVAGYAYIDAQYKEHVAFYPGSAPLNTPKHTANGWVNYMFDFGAIKGLSIGAGAYYIGERPINDWAQTVTHEGIVPGQKPFMIDAYTTLNAQLGYSYKNYGIRLLANNILNKVGYNAYRTSFINQTDPRNFAAVLTYNF